VVAQRETIYRIFAAIAQGRSPAAADLADLHAARLAALGAARLTWRRGEAELSWPAPEHDLLRPVYPLALLAGDLLTSPDLARLKQCGRHPCGWLFLDRTKNRSRRWCSSAECGNLTRVQRYRARRRGG
jgi:predicted RNA-binding Zn ribbon-like protein